jgi:hypothetical protein
MSETFRRAFRRQEISMQPRHPLAPALPALTAALLLSACAGENARSAQAAGSPASATASNADRSRCFFPSEVNGWRAAGDQTVYVRVGVNRVFQMKLMGPCPDIDWSETIGIEHRGSATICSGLDATIVSRSAIGPRRCPVTALRELTPEEIKALPPGSRP